MDDYPYGGGRGAVMQADPLYQCWKHIVDTYGPGRTIYMSPAGKTFDQAAAKRLKNDYDHLILVCGHYEGIDERFIEECVDEELSMGDFVLTGGEIPAMAVADAVARMVPGVLPDPECFEEESHYNGMLEYPQYSRPEVWHDRAVPSILLSGHHANIAKWRRKQALLRTRTRRPDLYARLDLSSKSDQKLLRELEAEDPEPPPLPDAILPFSAENMHFFSPGYTNFRGTALSCLRQLSQDFLELSCCSGTFFVKIQGKSLN